VKGDGGGISSIHLLLIHLTPSLIPHHLSMSDTCPHPQSSPWTFTQGLILGQLSFLVLVLLFVRYVVFSPSEQLDEEGWKRRRSEPHKVSSQTDGAGSALLIWRVQRAVLSTTGVPAPLPSLLLGKTGYDMATHPAESTDWLNVLFSQVSLPAQPAMSRD